MGRERAEGELHTIHLQVRPNHTVEQAWCHPFSDIMAMSPSSGMNAIRVVVKKYRTNARDIFTRPSKGRWNSSLLANIQCLLYEPRRVRRGTPSIHMNSTKTTILHKPSDTMRARVDGIRCSRVMPSKKRRQFCRHTEAICFGTSKQIHEYSPGLARQAVRAYDKEACAQPLVTMYRSP